MKCLLILMLGLGVTAGTAGAQSANPGDYLLASDPGISAIYVIAPYGHTCFTLARYPGRIRGVVVGPDNTDCFVASDLDLFRTTPFGVVTTVVTGLTPGAGTAWIDLDEDGQILVGTGWSNGGGLFRVNPTMGTYTTVLAGGIAANAFCLDRDTGDVIVGDTNGKRVYRVNRQGVATTVVSSINTIYAMDFHPMVGDAFIATVNDIHRLDATNRLTTVVTGAATAKALAVLASGHVLAGSHGSTMVLYDRNGHKVGVPYNGATLSMMALAVADENNVWGLNAPSVGGVFNISIRFTSHPYKPYVAAASFSRSPGIAVDSRVIPITPDSLLGASLSLPTMFSGFAGSLDPAGRGSAYIAIPKVAGISGIRFFLAAVVIDGTAPSGIARISQPYGVTIQ